MGTHALTKLQRVWPTTAQRLLEDRLRQLLIVIATHQNQLGLEWKLAAECALDDVGSQSPEP